VQLVVVGQQLLAAQKRLRELSLELAALEEQLKEAIGDAEGIELAGVGTFYWTKASKPWRDKRINWMAMVDDLKIPDKTLEKYKKITRRRRFFMRRPRFRSGPAKHTIDQMDHGLEEVALDAEL